MEQHLQMLPDSLDAPRPDEAGDALTRMAARLILAHQRQDGSVSTQGLARQLPPAAQACNVQPPALLRAVVSQLPPVAARRLAGAFPPASLAPRAPWRRKGCMYRMFDALPPVRWSRYQLRQSRYAWVRQRAADKLGVSAFTVVERATDAAVARFAAVVSLHCFAYLFAHDAAFRSDTVQRVRTLATPELENPSGAELRLNMVALSDLLAWHGKLRTNPDADFQLGAELVMLAIPAAVFDEATLQIRALMQSQDEAQ
ncbi:hypothetical protein SAMN05428989_3238 [Pseudoxanthomonas sp. GM95]|uniref:hypothetical protein n=1 Tax=Pseudoxanthomonas sp. GM95 TaxID=1881043 RepID=UPI0008D6A151|nr:hypothetical protein [Pseudoxanthomonas sp. GM95]SEM16250.1 hypothetical protein SAMN05428989_3238 [Pseudoxanthomonas sp. GM95]